MQLYHIILNNIRRRKLKMLFVLFGMVIGIATMVSVYTIVDSMKKEMTRKVSEYGVNMVITPNSGGLTFSYGGITLPEIMYDVEQLNMDDVAKLSNLQSKDMIRVVAPKLLGIANLNTGERVNVVGASIKEEFSIKPWLTITGVESEKTAQQSTVEKDMEYEKLDLIRQDLDLINLADNQIIVGSVLAETIKVKNGDKLEISGREFEVKYILNESGSVEDKQLIMNLGSAQEVLGRPGEVTLIDMSVDYLKGSEEVLLAEIKEDLPSSQVSSQRQETLRQDDLLNRLVRFGVSLSIIILIVGMLVISMTMSGAVRERTREIGIFRALGFRKSHIIKIILYEGLVTSLIGGVIGFIVGMIMATYAVPIFFENSMMVNWNLLLLFVSLIISVIIGLLSSIYPALKAAKLDPAEALRFI
jgi:putative ABC transport system permease protein